MLLAACVASVLGAVAIAQDAPAAPAASSSPPPIGIETVFGDSADAPTLEFYSEYDYVPPYCFTEYVYGEDYAIELPEVLPPLPPRFRVLAPHDSRSFQTARGLCDAMTIQLDAVAVSLRSDTLEY